MKREVSREKALPAFAFEMGDLELLWGRLVSLFDDPEDIYAVINVTLPSESLEFKNINELKDYTVLKGHITNFNFRISQGGRRVSFRSASFLGSRPVVSASAETEAWCAGAIETVYSFTQSNRVWYHWFVSAPLGWIFLIFANAPNIASLLLPKGQSIEKLVFAAWLAITITLGILYFARTKLLPYSVLIITNEENFIRRNAAELSLIVAIASAILTVVGWFWGK